MAGINQDVIYGSNVDFTGTFPVSGQMNLNGELLVGATTAPFIRSYVPIGTNGVSIATGPGTLDFSLSSVPNSALANSTINVIAGSGISVLGSPVSLGGNVTIAATSTITTTQYAVLVGDVGNTIASVGPGSAGQILRSGGAAANPAYSTATYPSIATGTGTILRADGTNWVASTPTFPNAASTSGKVIVSDGTNFITSTPTFPNASATSGKIIKSDGTNWVASTETYATPSTSGNVMTSDGTNWTSASAPGGGLLSTGVITITSAQIKALRATPITVISAPGSGKTAMVVSAIVKFNYAGTNVFTNGMSLSFRYVDASGTLFSTVNLISSTQIVAAASTYSFTVTPSTASNTNLATTLVENQPIKFVNLGASEITGNAANDNTITMTVLYYIVTL